MIVGFQTGIPDVFFSALVARGVKIVRFATSIDLPEDLDAIFFRANFSLNRKTVERLPNLRLASLVSTGTDNVDVNALSERGIDFVTGEGANAAAVCDYVIHALLCGEIDLKRHSVGVVGAGRVGSLVLKFLQRNQIAHAYFDPHLPEPGSLAAALQCDFVTFHVPLTDETRGMLSEEFFAPIKQTIQIVQTSRGGIWQREFYDALGDHEHIKLLAQDVYPVEPPDAQMLARSKFVTPHVAGYSLRGRLGGVVKGIQRLLPDFNPQEHLPVARAWFLTEESSDFRAAPHGFNAIRDGYFWRKELSEYNLPEQEAFYARYERARSLKIF